MILICPFIINMMNLKKGSLLSLNSIIAVSLLIASCSGDKNEFTIGEEFIESGTSIQMVDTFSVRLSTVLSDSLPTSLIDTILVGNYRDNLFGRVTCNSYFEIGLPEYDGILTDDYFDSMTITLPYTGYSFGDTLKPLYLYVYRLTDEITADAQSGYLYNTSSFAHEAQPLATLIIEPRPNTYDSIEFRINDIFGEMLFDMLRLNESEIGSESAFLQFFNGLVIKADTNYNSSIVGFDASSGDVKLTLYTHRIGEFEVSVEYEFPLINVEKQFNEIEYSFYNSILSTYNFSGLAIPSDEMDNKSFTQGGVGLMTKIEFPSLNEFLLFENSAILKVELIIKPARLSYNTFSLPENIYLYNTDRHNQLGNLLYGSDGNVLTPTFEYDELFYESTSYTYDITDFIKDEMSDSYFDTEHGLIMTFSYEEYLCSLNRVVFEALNDAAMLRIYYVKY
jgi:hypothetical protein